MKKLLTMMLATTMIFALLTGCAGDDTKTDEGTDTGKSYPNKTIQITVPYKAGGDTDMNARVLAKYLQEEFDQPVVIVNMEGGGGSVAARDMMDKPADGYSSLFWHSSILINDLIGISDFTYEDMKIAAIPNVSDVGVWVVSGDSPYETVEDIVTQLKADPNSLGYATAVGNYSHLQALVFEDVAGVELKKVDLGGTSNNIASLLGGQVDIVPIEYGLAKDYIESGDFRVIGSVTETRSELIPEIPTFLEQGYDMTNGFEKFYFVAFPKETPDDIIATFNEAVVKVMANEEAAVEFGKFMFTERTLIGQDAADYIAEKDEIYKKYQEVMLNDKF